jgi:hypothetical protein
MAAAVSPVVVTPSSSADFVNEAKRAKTTPEKTNDGSGNNDNDDEDEVCEKERKGKDREREKREQKGLSTEKRSVSNDLSVVCHSLQPQWESPTGKTRKKTKKDEFGAKFLFCVAISPPLFRPLFFAHIHIRLFHVVHSDSSL